MAACTWPSTDSNLSQTLKKAKYLKLTQLLSKYSVNVPTTFHGAIVSKLPTQAWNKAKSSPQIPLKRALSKRENHSTNDAFWLVESRDAHRLLLPLVDLVGCVTLSTSLSYQCSLTEQKEQVKSTATNVMALTACISTLQVAGTLAMSSNKKLQGTFQM